MVLGDVCDPVSRWRDFGCVDWSAHDQWTISLEGDHYQEDEVSDDADDNQGTQENETPPVVETGGASKSRAQRASWSEDTASRRSRQVFDDTNLAATSKVVALALAHLMGDEAEIAVTLSKLAAMTGANARTVARHLELLEQEGYIAKNAKGDVMQPGVTRNIYVASERWTNTTT